MIAALAGKILLRQVPKPLVAGVNSGKLGIYGSVIREVATGRISGYLQEAAPIGALVANPGTAMPTISMLALKTAAQAGQLVQNEFVRQGVQCVETGVGRLEDGMERVEAGIGRIADKLDVVDEGLQNVLSGVEALNQIGLANLAVSTAGIGVSIVGFAVMAAKLDRISNSIHGLSGQLDTAVGKIEAVQNDLIESDFSDLKSLAKAHDEGWLLSDASAGARWQEVAREALRFQSRFENRAERVLAGNPGGYMLADPMLDAVGFASGLRVAALSACNEANAAREAAADGARAIERLTGSIGLADLTRPALAASEAAPGTVDWTVALAAANEDAREVVAKIRQREAAAVTRAAPLAALERRGIRPRDWLEVARAERGTPVLVMLEEELDEAI